MTVPPLPVELYAAILSEIPSSKEDPSEQTLFHCLRANSVLRAAALAPQVWKTPYLVRYMHADEQRERQRRTAVAGDWRKLFVQRRTLDYHALRALDTIRNERVGRHTAASTIVKDYGFDVWDAFREESSLPVPAWCHDQPPEDTAVQPPRDALPRRYWAQVMLGVISRHSVIGMWSRVAQVGDQSVSFEEALAGLSAFFDVSTQEVLAELEVICDKCIENLVDKGVPLDPDEPGYDFWNLVEEIREAIHDMGFGIAQGPEFYRVTNQFPHFFLKPEGRRSIPMSLVYVFVAVARRLGIQASPANFPGVVQAHIQPPNGERAKLMDMRGTDPPSEFPNTQYIQFWPAMLQNQEEYSHPAAPSVMLSRACNNIQAFMQQEMVAGVPQSPEVHDSAFYAGSCWIMVEGAANHIVPSPPDSKPLDFEAVLIDVLCPMLPSAMRNALSAHFQRIIEDDEARARSIKLHSSYPRVAFFVGLPFVHKRYNYLGVIYGWDPTCMASEEWMEQMHVDALEFGRNQPFYRVIPAEGQPRYVAQENISPVVKSGLSELFQCHSLIGRYFVDLERDSRIALCRLLPSKELRDMYPEDDAFGASFVNLEAAG
ncbi:YccV-like-domain-containing protein [Phanerochaete sordida]|uniref:YccV-like-domain-containing protein n=1 Tax=Phanerochaete sordida TaxID=48140 RepID=A0A9P3L8S8_9APHY|nr:YccV-like-domain-containing protein [Phanerochaete sordida]